MIRGHRPGFKLEMSSRRKRRRSRNSGASGIGDWPRLGSLRGGRMDANTHEKLHADESEAHFVGHKHGIMNRNFGRLIPNELGNCRSTVFSIPKSTFFPSQRQL